MKKLILGTALSAGLLLAGAAQAKFISPSTEANLVKICQAIKSNSKVKLHIAIRDSGIDVRNLNKGLVCNGYDPVTFAVVSNAEKNAKFLAARSNIDYEELLAQL